MAIQVYGLPNCGTCKKAFAWLNDNNIEYEFVNYQENPPSKNQLEEWVETLGAKALRNTSGNSYRAIGPIRDTWSDDDWIDAYSRDPMLIKRPVILKNNRAISVGFRNPEDLKKTLEH